MKRGDLLSLRDLTSAQIEELLNRALALKARRETVHVLKGRSLALLFEKPSLRTRASFEVAMYELGGRAFYFSPEEVGLGKREAVPDIARVLSQYVDAIAARTFRHADVACLAESASVPVINALSDFCHPCQGLADLLTLKECFGDLRGLRIAYIGDGNNIATTLLFAAARTGLQLRLASPLGYEPRSDVVAYARAEAEKLGGSITVCVDPRDAAYSAQALYTDVWTSMGQEAEASRRRRDFAAYRIDADLLKVAEPGAVVMHDLPAHRGEEITDDVIDGAQSVVFQQAGNRLHAQKAVLLWLMETATDHRQD